MINTFRPLRKESVIIIRL